MNINNYTKFCKRVYVESKEQSIKLHGDNYVSLHGVVFGNISKLDKRYQDDGTLYDIISLIQKEVEG